MITARIKWICLVMVLLACGCTNALYQGEQTALDAYGQQRRFVLYWTRTEPLIGEAKAGPAILLTECSPTRIDFSDQQQGIVFRGMPGEDRPTGESATVAPDQICGEIMGHDALRDIAPGPVEVRIDCQPMPPDDFDLQPRNYLAPSPPLHRFDMVETRRAWSFFGQTFEAPQPPACRER